MARWRECYHDSISTRLVALRRSRVHCVFFFKSAARFARVSISGWNMRAMYFRGRFGAFACAIASAALGRIRLLLGAWVLACILIKLYNLAAQAPVLQILVAVFRRR